MSTLDPLTGFTCVACKLVFKTADLQRDHYKTEWHRYNLKRHVAELPPVTAEQFDSKVAVHKPNQTGVVKSEETFYCATCKKQLKSKNAYENHEASKKHAELMEKGRPPPKQQRKKKVVDPTINAVAMKSEAEDVVMESEGEDNQDDEDDDDSSGWETDNGEEEDEGYNEDEALPLTSCLFCHQTKENKEQMSKHMLFHHDFTLPDKEYLTDEDGMLRYLGLKVGAGRVCILCPDIRSRFATVQACQAHMRDKQHCRIARDPQSMLEFAEFYDYSPMYEKAGEESDVFYDNGWTLTLPSGAEIGHRSLMQYYRQKLRPIGSAKRNVGKAALDKAHGLFRALAWTGTTAAPAKQLARDLRFVDQYRRKFDLRVKSCSQKKSKRLFKTSGRIGDNK